MTTGQRIRQKAISFVDEKELKNNSGFKNPKFEALMKLTGWRKGQAWCAFFVELVWKVSGCTGINHFSGGAVQTWNNFAASPFFGTSDIPEVGDVVIWQTYRNGKARWTGHAGIVIGLDRDQMITVEGNTNSKGGREGIEVAMKIRKRNDFKVKNGLRLRGFIKPIINND